MAIATPATATITPATGFIHPAMGPDALATALDNTNFLYLGHCPPLVDYSPIAVTTNDARTYTVPIQPSLDGIDYEFRVVLLPAFNGNLSIGIQESATYGGAYTDVVAATVTAVLNGTWQVVTFTAPILAASRVLRLKFSAVGGAFYLSHFIAFPAPSAVALAALVAPTASGFRVFEDSLLRDGAGTPINTEYVDRTLHNARAVLRDRQQCVFSLVQEDGSRYLDAPPAATITTDPTIPMQVGHTRCHIPHNGDVWIEVRSIAEVSAGSSVDRVLVQVAGQPTVALDAPVGAAVQTARMLVKGPAFDVSVYVACTAVAPAVTPTTSLYSIVGLWRPGDEA